jgi:hypothetical protein
MNFKRPVALLAMFVFPFVGLLLQGCPPEGTWGTALPEKVYGGFPAQAIEDEAGNLYVLAQTDAGQPKDRVTFLAKVTPDGKLEWSTRFNHQFRGTTNNTPLLTRDTNGHVIVAATIYYAGDAIATQVDWVDQQGQIVKTWADIPNNPVPTFSLGAALGESGPLILMGGDQNSLQLEILVKDDETDALRRMPLPIEGYIGGAILSPEGTLIIAGTSSNWDVACQCLRSRGFLGEVDLNTGLLWLRDNDFLTFNHAFKIAVTNAGNIRVGVIRSPNDLLSTGVLLDFRRDGTLIDSYIVPNSQLARPMDFELVPGERDVMLLLGSRGSPYGDASDPIRPTVAGYEWYSRHLDFEFMHSWSVPFYLSFATDMLMTHDQKSVVMIGTAIDRDYKNPQLFVHKFPLESVVPN